MRIGDLVCARKRIPIKFLELTILVRMQNIIFAIKLRIILLGISSLTAISKIIDEKGMKFVPRRRSAYVRFLNFRGR